MTINNIYLFFDNLTLYPACGVADWVMDFITWHYITLQSLDQNLIRMTVGCGMCYINTKIELKFSYKKTHLLHMRLFRNTSTYIHQICCGYRAFTVASCAKGWRDNHDLILHTSLYCMWYRKYTNERWVASISVFSKPFNYNLLS
jgi:hypothetical protein